MGTSQVGLRDIQSTKRASRLRLLAPMRYLLIEAPEKHFYDVTLPLVAGLVGWTIYNVLEPAPAFFGPTGILVTAQSFLIMAVPFLIGSLGAVAMGSPGQHLDRRAVGVGIFLEGESLTLRQFVSYLLGYLCFVGLVSFVGITVAIWVQPALVTVVTKIEWLQLVVMQIGIGLTMLLFSAFIITVLWALYFLTDIVNRHE